MKTYDIKENNSFNTQPPEGGWPLEVTMKIRFELFQHTAARRRLESNVYQIRPNHQFQHTAARRRLVFPKGIYYLKHGVSTHSRPKAAGLVSYNTIIAARVSTHSRPKAAGAMPNTVVKLDGVSTHSRPKAAGIGQL